jgi:hypothetical protein
VRKPSLLSTTFFVLAFCNNTHENQVCKSGILVGARNLQSRLRSTMTYYVHVAYLYHDELYILLPFEAFNQYFTVMSQQIK